MQSRYNLVEILQLAQQGAGTFCQARIISGYTRYPKRGFLLVAGEVSLRSAVILINGVVRE